MGRRGGYPFPANKLPMQVNMALVICPECREQVSSLALSCPKCGYPIAQPAGTQPAEGKQPRSGCCIVMVCLGLFLVVVMGCLWVGVGIPFIQKLREANQAQ